MMERFLQRFGPIVLALVCGAVGFVYIQSLYFIAALWTGAGHGNYTPVRLLGFPFNYGPIFWLTLFALCGLAKYRVFSFLGILLLLFYYATLWMYDAFCELRRFATPLASVFIFVFNAHLFFTLNMLVFFIYQLFRRTKTTGALPASVTRRSLATPQSDHNS